ncbi:hypothetical protein CTAYLR_007178 [Chrysophaeum taylorii]|uniref:HMA domain-containing protein n=1 Tax=Chrysophaeum taylorii TaxID=2483200 RepID=A0AAD7XSX1_9STRA|nr:hypothetical protein CTAYLR_007178 [Chrysophaeum taylorii]
MTTTTAEEEEELGAVTKLRIGGMMCQQSCGSTVQAALAGVAGVKVAEVSYPRGEAMIWWSGEAMVSAAIEAVEAVGFEASSRNPSTVVCLRVEGMMCQKSCGATVEAALSGVPGVTRAQVSYPRKRAEVTCAVEGLGPQLVEAVEVVGFEAFLAEDPDLEAPPRLSSSSASEGLRRSELVVRGIRSPSDARAVEAAAASVPGVERCDVAVTAERCVVTHRRTVSSADVVAAIRAAGFPSCFDADAQPPGGGSSSSSSSSVVAYLWVEGMSCAACSAKVEKALARVPGVASASVSSTTHKAKVALTSGPPREAVMPELVRAVEGLGFKARDAGGASGQTAFDASEREVAGWRSTFLWALFLTGPLVVVKWATMLLSAAAEFWHQGLACQGRLSRVALFQFAMGSVIQAAIGGRFARAAARGLRTGNYGMDLLVALATCIVWLYSTLSLVECCAFHSAHDHSMFETSAMLLFFVSLGKFLEANAKQRASGAIAALLRMQPKMAFVLMAAEDAARRATLRKDDTREDDDDALEAEAELREALASSEVSLVSRDELAPGAVLVVQPGAAVPADGVVACALSGVAFVDEAAVTGESVPAEKRRGDVVFGATINRGAAFVVRATQTGEASTIAQIARLVEEAQLSKAPVQEFADAVASKFTPAILGLAALTFGVWYALAATGTVPEGWIDDLNPFLFALLFGVSVVVVACPCALGLATPTAVMCGTGVGASLGILVKGGDVLEKAHAVDAVVFDKTGTLTTGEPVVTDEIAVCTSKDEALALAASAESASEHPLARAVVRAARARSLALDAILDATSVPGRGVRAVLKTRGDVAVGNVEMMRSNLGLELPDEISADVDRLRAEAKTALLIASKGRVLALLGVADAPRPEAAAAIAALPKKTQVWMLTGDHRETALAVARQVGIPPDRVEAGVLPEDKSTFVRRLGDRGRVVAMVGDGVNDSPALAAADVGLAIGGGTQVAIEAADVVLIKSDLRDVVVALDLSRAVYRRIKTNFVWATVYNLVLVPLAAGALFPLSQTRLHPATAALCMAFSSVSVVCSSLALKLYAPPRIPARNNAEPLRDLDAPLLDSPQRPAAVSAAAAAARACRRCPTWLAALRARCRVRCRQWLYAVAGVHLYAKCLDDPQATPCSPPQSPTTAASFDKPRASALDRTGTGGANGPPPAVANFV